MGMTADDMANAIITLATIVIMAVVILAVVVKFAEFLAGRK